jgi:RNA polymerase sigma-70 factor (ECF subfamily)
MPVSTAEQRQAIDRFIAAIRQGDLQGLLEVLAPDVIAVSDGGGLVAATQRPIQGARRVATFLVNAARIENLETRVVWLNGSPGVRIDIDGELNTAVTLTVENGRVTHIYAIRNPHKLAHLDGVATLTRT